MKSGHTHADLVDLGARWAKRQGFPVVTTEIRAAGSREEPDVLAFRGQCSLLIEAKTSRGDFLADFKKPERIAAQGGLGVYRLYLCPAELLGLDDIPPKWGLLWARGQRIEQIRMPKGNIWPGYSEASRYPDTWGLFAHAPDHTAERAVMYSIARRRALSRSETKYETQIAQLWTAAAKLARRTDALAEENRMLKLAAAAASFQPGQTAIPRQIERQQPELAPVQVSSPSPRPSPPGKGASRPLTSGS